MGFAYKLLVLLFFFLLFVSPNPVLAVSVSPATVTVDYVPGERVVIPLRLGSNLPGESYGVLEVINSSLSEYVSLETERVRLPDTGRVNVNAYLQIPVLEGVYGRQSVRIFVTEVTPEQAEQMIVVRTGINFRIDIDFPYPGKYVEISRLSVPSIREGDQAGFEWSVISRGSESSDFSATLELFDGDGEVFDVKEYSTRFLAPRESHSESGVFDTSSFLPGEYDVVLSVLFDSDKHASRTATFRVGEEDVALKGFEPSELRYNSITPVRISVESLWADTFSNVYAEVSVNDRSSRTPSESLNAFSVVDLNHFVDTSGFEPGEYEALITVFFDGLQRDFSVPVTVLSEAESRARFGDQDSGGSSVQVLLIVMVILVILAFINVLFMFLRKDKKGKD